jgi:hypothetical protein
MGFEGLYEVSSFGRVKSNYREWFYTNRYGTTTKASTPTKILKERIHTRGYIFYSIGKDGIFKNFYGHRLVAEAFITKVDGKTCINHINSKKTDNRGMNLEWVSYMENTNHGIRNGTIKHNKLGRFVKV